MKYLAAYALIALSGKKQIKAADVKSLLSSVQSHATDDQINKVIQAVRGKSIHQLIADGQTRLGNSAPAASIGKPAEKKEKQAPKKAEQPKKKVEQAKKKVEEAPKEEEDADLGDLFG